MEAWKVILIVAAAVLLLLFAVAFGVAGIAMTGRRQTLEEALKWQGEHYDTGWFERELLKEYTIEGEGGYLLHAAMYPAPKPSGKYVILSHGYTDNRFGNLKYMRMYLPYGYNCIIYDLRGHGQNAAAPTTYGVLESLDLLKVIEDTVKRYAPETLGLHGESLGAATTVTCLGYRPRVDFAVADCPFSDITNVLKRALKDTPVAGMAVALGSIGARLRFGVSFGQMRPVDAVKDNHIPLLLIHGAADDFIVPDNSRRIYDMNPGEKDLLLVEGAGHAESAIRDCETYKERLGQFLKAVSADRE